MDTAIHQPQDVASLVVVAIFNRRFTGDVFLLRRYLAQGVVVIKEKVTAPESIGYRLKLLLQ